MQRQGVVKLRLENPLERRKVLEVRLLTVALVDLVACGGSGELVAGGLAAEVLRARLWGSGPLVVGTAGEGWR